MFSPIFSPSSILDIKLVVVFGESEFPLVRTFIMCRECKRWMAERSLLLPVVWSLIYMTLEVVESWMDLIEIIAQDENGD